MKEIYGTLLTKYTNYKPKASGFSWHRAGGFSGHHLLWKGAVRVCRVCQQQPLFIQIATKIRTILQMPVQNLTHLAISPAFPENLRKV